MVDGELDDVLALLAEHGARYGKLQQASAIRAGADRRRGRRHAAGGVVTLLVVAALGAQVSTHRLGEAAPPSQGPSAVALHSPTAAPADGDLLSGRREVAIASEPSLNSLLAVQDDHVELSGEHDRDRTLFVLVPDGDAVRIETARLRVDARPMCLTVRRHGSSSRTLGAAVCESGAAPQLFHFDRVAAGPGAATRWVIENDAMYVQWYRAGDSGLVVEPAADTARTTTFLLVDRGLASRAHLPTAPTPAD